MAEEDSTPELARGDALSLAQDTQPYPRSPKSPRKNDATSHKYSEEQLSCLLEELESENKKIESRMASLKKRQANLTSSAETMGQQIRERFEAMRLALERDEVSVLEALEQERRESSSRLTRVLQDWSQQLKLLRKHSSNLKKLQETTADGQQQVHPEDFSCHKKVDKAEDAVSLNEEKFQKLMKALGKMSKELQAQIQRRNLLLDSSEVVIDRQASHRQIQVSPGGRSLHVSLEDSSLPTHPLQFDQVYCALGSAPIKTGKHYWEVDVGCCSSWAVGVAYANMHKKGQDKSTKLGRNRNSWSLEFQDGHLTAWHNDRNVALSAKPKKGALRKVGVFVNYQKGRVAFYDAEAVKMLQEFSAAFTAAFDRAHHQFTEPLFPAFRFFKPRDGHSVPDHMEICDLSL